MSQLTVNVTESELPVPDTGSDTSVPGTGILTVNNSGNGGAVAAGAVSLFLLTLVVVFVVLKRHYNFKLVAGRSRWLAKGLVLLAIVVSGLVFSMMQTRYDDVDVKAVDNNNGSLSISTEDIVMSVEVMDKPVYAMVPNKVTVESATYAGYVLSAYVTSPDLVSGDSSEKITSLDGDNERSLGNNAWGVALTFPEDQSSEVFFGLSEDSGNPSILREVNSATSVSDETTVYYGTYVTPELPEGVYTGATINYVAVAIFNPDAPVTDEQVGVVFDGNDMEFENGEGKNRANYEEECRPAYAGEPVIIKTDNIDDDGVQHGSYTEMLSVYRDLVFEGVKRLEVELKYDIPDNGGGIAMNTGKNWSGFPAGDDVGFSSLSFNVYNNEIKIDAYVSGSGVPPHDYGLYVKVTPIYLEQRGGTEEVERCFFARTAGDYEEPARMARYWLSGDGEALYGEEGVAGYLDEHKDELLGGLVTIVAYSPNRIVYDENGATAGTMEGYYSDWPLGATSGTTSLMAPNLYKEGYGFVGWSEDPAALSNSGSVIYGPNEKVDIRDFTFDEETHEKVLYAVWAPSEGTLQDFDSCDEMEIGQVTALTDARDNNTYAVAKYDNGRCWMMENLRLEAENSSDGTLAEGFGGVFSGLPQSEERAGFTIFETIFNEKYTEENILGNNITYRIPRYNNSNTRMGDNGYLTSPGGTDAYGELWVEDEYSKWFGYGNYYNWPAAMANTEDIFSDSEYVGTSICPKGWHLPEYNRNYDFSLFGSSVKNWVRFPHNFVYSGSLTYDVYSSRGKTGVYLSSSTEYTQSVMTPIITFDWDSVYVPGQAKVYGYSVRCLADY